MDSDGYKIPRRFHVSSSMLGEFAQKRGRGVIVDHGYVDARSHPLTGASRSTVSCHVSCVVRCWSALRASELGASCEVRL